MDQQDIAAFIDVEATGLNAPEPVEVTLYIVPDGPAHWPIDSNMLWTQRYEPSKAMELGAIATHHIVPADLRGCPPSSSFVLTPAVKYIIGHNVDYDWQVIGSPAHVRRICTLALSHLAWPDLSSHKLTALMYHTQGATPAVRDLVIQAHGSRPDTQMLFQVFSEILPLVVPPEKWANLTWEDVWAISEEARIPKRMDFGKYGPKPEEGRMQGMLISDMRKPHNEGGDPGYVKWLLANACSDKPYLMKALTR